MTPEKFNECAKEADRQMKESNGHTYMTILKTRCVYCGRSPNVKTRCGRWLNTFMDRLSGILQKEGVIKE